MKSNNSLLLCAVLGIAPVVLGTAFLFLGGQSEFQIEYGYFVRGSLFAAALYVSLTAGCLLGLFMWIFNRKSSSAGRILPGGLLMSAFSVLCGAVILAVTVADILYFEADFTEKFTAIRYISRVLSVPAAVSLVLSAFRGKKEQSAFGCVLEFFTPLYFASKALVDYFDHSTAVNSPVKIICQLTFIAFMLMFTAEEGISLGRDKIYPRYLFCLFCSVTLGLSAGLGGLLLSLAGISFPMTVEDAALFLCIGIYAAGRLFGAAAHPEEVCVADSGKSDAAEADAKAKSEADSLGDIDFSESARISAESKENQEKGHEEEE